MSDFYGNSLTYNSSGTFDLSDDYKEQLYLECCSCKDHVHVSKGEHDKDDFYCNECFEIITNK